MKVFLSGFVAVVCVIVLVLGNNYYKDRISNAASVEEEVPNKSSEKLVEKDEMDSQNYESMTKNWPAESVNLFKQKSAEHEPFKILLAGSAVNEWTENVKKEVEDVYKGTVEVSVMAFDMNSLDFINQNHQADLIKSEADMIIFEPLTLKDNSKVANKDSLDAISIIISDVQNAKEDTTFVLQPPYPVYQGINYPVQVEELKEYAEKNEITYLDHWTAWPDYKTTEMKDYLTEDLKGPNEKGFHIWSTYVNEFLISKL